MNSASVRQNLAFASQPVPSWPVQAFQLVTLWDMLPFLADIFYFTNHRLDALRCELKQRAKDAFLSREDIEAARFNFNALKAQCEKVGFAGVVRRLEDIEVMFINAQYDANEQVSVERMRFQLQELHMALARDLKPHLFMAIPPDDVAKYDQKRLFGPKVNRNFKSTRFDVAEAGNCYAVGRYTACVFHCMRVLEKGLHALVHDINAKHNAGIVFKKRIEEKNWGEILGKIDCALKESNKQNLNPQPTKADFRFYSKATIHFEHFLRAWRNDVSHARKSYNQTEAQEVMDHVEAFMKQIATRLTETLRQVDNPSIET